MASFANFKLVFLLVCVMTLRVYSALSADLTSHGGSAALSSTSPTRITIAVDALAETTSAHFLAHGYEPFSLWIALPRLLASPTALALLGHLRGATVRIGGITADWVHIVNDTTVSSPCTYEHGAWGTICNVTTGAIAAIVDAFAAAGISTLFDVNELLGRDCTQPEPGASSSAAEWCGAAPADWDTRDLSMLVQWASDTGRLREDKIAGLELGNELFVPKHLLHATAIADATAFARVAGGVAGRSFPLFAPATNDCARANNSDVMEALLSAGVGFSWHNYPGGSGAAASIDFLLNASWLRGHTLGDGTACLAAWNAGGKASLRARGLAMAVTETAAVYGTTPPGAANTSSFLHGFFTLSNLGQMARAGVAIVARWGLPTLVIAPPLSGGAWEVAADYWLYMLHSATVGRGVLAASGDETGDALVWAHCASAAHGGGVNGSVTLLALNPSGAPVVLALSLPSVPRVAFVLEAPGGNVAARAPTLNGGAPLVAGAAGDLPPLQGAYCGGAACEPNVVLPPRSQAFFVLLGARAPACSV